MSNEHLTGKIGMPTGPQRFSLPHATTRGVIENAEKYVDGDIGAWDYSYTPPQAQGFFGSLADRRRWKNVNFQAGLTGRHTEAQRWNRVLAGLPEAAGDDSFAARADTGAGAVIPFYENMKGDPDAFLAPDENFVAADEVAKVDPFVMETGIKYDPLFEEKLNATTSKHAFDLTVNRAMKSSQLLQQIEADDAAGMLGGWGTSVVSAFGNYVIFDEDTTRTAGLGAIVKGAAGAVRGVEKATNWAAKAAVGGSYRTRHAAHVAKTPVNPTLALHEFIATKAGVTRGAMYEGAALGLGFDAGFQYDAVTQANLMYGDEQNMVTYNPAHTLMAGGLGAGIGWALPTLINKFSKMKTSRRDPSDYPDDIQALVESGELKFTELARQHGDDKAMTDINNRIAALSVTASEDIPAVGWMLSRELLDQHGRTVDELEHFTRYLELAGENGVDMNSGVLQSALEEFMLKGVDITKTSAKAKRKRAAAAKLAAAKALEEADGDPKQALLAIQNRRNGERAVTAEAKALGVSRERVSLVNGMPVLNVSHSGVAPSSNQIWPGSHYGSREASQHFAGSNKTSHSGPLSFNKALMMTDTQGQHDPKAIITELLNHARSLEGTALPTGTEAKLMKLFNEFDEIGFQRGEEAVASYQKIGQVLREDLGVDGIVYRNSQEDMGSVSFISFADEGPSDWRTIGGEAFRAFADDSAAYEMGAMRMTTGQWTEFLSGLSTREQEVWSMITERIKASDSTLTSDEAASLAGNLFGLRRGMIDELDDAAIRTTELTWSPEAGVERAMMDLIDKFKKSANPIDESIANQLENNAARLNRDSFKPVSDAALRDADSQYFLRSLGMPEDQARLVDDGGWWTGVQIMDDIAADNLDIAAHSWHADAATGMTLRLVERTVDYGSVPGAVKRTFEETRQQVINTFLDQDLPTETLIRVTLDWMPEADKKTILQGAANFLDAATSHPTMSVHEQAQRLLSTRGGFDKALGRAGLDTSNANASPVRPTNRPAPDVLTPAQRQARSDEVNALMRVASDSTQTDAARRAARLQAMKLSDDSGLTDTAYYAGSPVTTAELNRAVKVSGRNLAELADSASQTSLFKFQQTWIGVSDLSKADPKDMHALARVWWESNNKRNKLSTLVTGAPKKESLPPVGLRDDIELIDQDILELETMRQIWSKERDDAYNEAISHEVDSPEWTAAANRREEADRMIWEAGEELEDLQRLHNERRETIHQWLEDNPEAISLDLMRKPAKTYQSDRAAALVKKFAEDPAAFRNISERHKQLGLALEAAVKKNHISPETAKVVRAMWSQSDLKFLENVDIRFTGKTSPLLHGGSRLTAGGVVERVGINSEGKMKWRTTPTTVEGLDAHGAVVTIGHELLHIALMATPGMRRDWVKLHSKIINNPRALGRARAAIGKMAQTDDPDYLNYFLHDADEFFVEFGSRYLVDSKFREVLLEIAEDGSLAKRMADMFLDAVGKVVPFMNELNIGMNKKDMERFFGMVDQAAGFRPVTRQKYLTGDDMDLGWLYKALGPTTDRMAENEIVNFPMAELIQQIRAAAARGDDEAVAQLNKKMQKIYGKKVTSSGQVLGKHISKMTAAERAAAVGAAFERIEETQADVVTGTNAISRAFQVAGLGPLLNKIITNRQGLGHTMFSDFAELRAVTSLFDVGRWGMQKIGAVGPKNLQGAKNWAIRQFEPVTRSLEDLRRVAGSRAKFDEIQAEMVKMLARGDAVVPASHPHKAEVQAALDAWKRYMSMMREKGLSNGVIRNTPDEATFMPLRLDPAKVRGREGELIEKLTRHWMKQFTEDAPETPLSTQTMRDTLGWYSQKLDKDGRPMARAEIDPVQFPDGKLPKTLGDLTPLQKEAYLKALTEPVHGLDGKTAIEHAAANYMRRQLGEEGFSGGVREFNKRRDTGRAAASHKTPNARPRRFTQEEVFIDNPDLGEFMVTDLFELGNNYAGATGFRIAAQDVLDDFLGFRGLGWHEFLVTMEQRTIDKLGMDDQSTAALRGGYEKLHEVFADLAGGLPHMDSGYNTVNRFGADAGRQSALMLYGSGIGTTMVGVENMWSIFSKIHTPGDLIQNIANLLKGWGSAAGMSRAVREELEGTIMGVKRMQQHTANRFVTGSVESPGQLHWQDRLVAPWKTAVDTLTGKITPGGEQGRASATTLRTMEALGQNAQQLGLNRVFNETSWLIQSRSTKREMKRYWARAQKLAADLESNPIQGLEPERRAAEFKKRARLAGFGDRWDIARRFDEGNLLDTGRLERLGALSGKSFEFGDMQRHGLTLAGEARAKYFDDLDALTFVVENEVGKRISEASSLYKTTDVASRTFIGQLMNSMFSFSRAFYTNQVLDAPGMPSRVFAGMIASYMFWEIFTSQARAVLDGEDPQNVADRWMDDPIGELMSNASRVPLLGAYSAIPRYGIDTARQAMGNDEVRAFGYTPHQSAGTGAFEKIVQLGTDMFSAPVKYATGEQDGGEIAEDMWKHYKTVIPGVGSFWGEALSNQFDPTHGER
ncbi:MAG: hypothetical protein GY872_04965 [Roseibacillus sp.]|nr:hypothetical protein [Roseibacillus sp.]